MVLLAQYDVNVYVWAKLVLNQLQFDVQLQQYK